ncbi:hypothetical protein ACPF04_01175 [Campylobacter sp. MOP51]|uniref:hypothetical protein n=1 Tax=Campylobacter canis TaxID=3378588 RepID=UPI003C5650A3
MGGVGTRRWAKFAKYLSRKNYEVHVLTINYNQIDKVNWLYDIDDNSNIIVHRIPSGYCNFILYENKNLFQKIISKLIYYIFKNTMFYIDIAQNWAKHMIPYASKLISEHNISNVIVSSPPHSLAYQATYLKIQFPQINLIQDFRDNWNDDEYYAYQDSLKLFRHKEKSVYMETFTIQHSDWIVNITQDLTTRLCLRYPLYEKKFKTIYNGFDYDDISKDFNEDNIASEKIKIVYCGSLDSGRIKAIYMILKSINDLNLNHLFELNIYTSYQKSKIDIDYINFLDKLVFFHDFIPPKDILKVISTQDYCLSINSPIYPYAFGTKIFDYMMLNKKIIHISEDGELSKVLFGANQYVSNYNDFNIRKMVLRIVDERNSYCVNDYNDFNINSLTSKIEDLLV